MTEAGVRLNVSVALQYLDAWLGGNGAAAINNLMEDAATAEICRSQLWQWRTTGTKLDDGARPDGRALHGDPRRGARRAWAGRAAGHGHLADAAELLDGSSSTTSSPSS